MKKQNLSELIRGKGYYLLLFVGIIAIGLVAIIGMQLSSKREKNNVDLNGPEKNIASSEDNLNQLAENNVTEEEPGGPGVNITPIPEVQENASVEPDNDSLLEFDVYAEADDATLEQEESPVTETIETAEVTVAPEIPQSVPVNRTEAINLSFGVDSELAWPVKGNVVMPYSMEHSIYFPTLQLYKCNPAIMIDCEVGTEVLAASKGVVTEVKEDPEIGFSVTMDIGGGYEATYGQLANVSLKTGDVVKKSEQIGTVNYPTKYYSIEGINLYFELTKDGVPENPMLYLE